MRGLLDYDTTIANTFEEQIQALNHRYNTNYTLDMFTMWRSEEILTEEQGDFLWGHNCFLSEDFQSKVQPVPGAINAVFNLMEAGVQFVIASDRPDSLYDVTRTWLNSHGLRDVKLIFTHHKNAIATPATHVPTPTKLQIIEEMGLSFAIDDAPHHAEAFAELPSIQEIYLLDMPYNRGISHRKVYRSHGWCQVLDWFYMLHPEMRVVKTSGAMFARPTRALNTMFDVIP